MRVYNMKILHICDLQIGIASGKERTKEEIEDRKCYFRELAVRLRNIVQWDEIDYIFVTGDITYSASREEYERAAVWLGRIADICKVPLRRFYLCPGDHDMDRDEGSFRSYEAFCRKLGTASYRLSGKQNYLSGIASTSDLNVICLNTPSLAQSDLSAGEFTERIKRERRFGNGLPTIMIMHHPCLCPDLYALADMVLTGHRNEAVDGYRFRDDTYICSNGAICRDGRYYHNFHIYEIGDHSEGGMDCVRTVYEYNGIGWRRQSADIKIAITEKRETRRDKPLQYSFSVLWWTRLEL